MEANGRSRNLMKFFNEMSSQGRPVVQGEDTRAELSARLQYRDAASSSVANPA